jgi:ACS family glucarate transporter-like MFS transporter
MHVRSDPWHKSLPPTRYLLVLWLFVMSAVTYLDRTNISIAGVQISREFAIDNTHLGWIFSAFLIGYAIFQIPAGLLARRLGPRRVLSFGIALCSVFAALTALVSPTVRSAVLLLALVRFGLGSGEAVMYPCTSQFVKRWFPVDERGKANGLIFAGVGMGAGLTPPLVTAIILRHGWRAAFWFSAAIDAVASLVWYLAARDTPREHPLIADAEKALIDGQWNQPALSPLPVDASRVIKPAVPWAKIFRSKEVFALTSSYFAYGYVAWIFFAWFYIYMAQVRGLNLKASAAFSMLPFIAMTLGSLGGGFVSDWIASHFGLRMGRCLLPTLSFACTAILLVVGSRVHSATAGGLILACGAGVLYISQSAFFAVTADIAGENVGVVSAIMNMGGQAGGACTASLTPLIAAHFGWEMSFVTAASVALLGGAAWLIINPLKVWHESDSDPKRLCSGTN